MTFISEDKKTINLPVPLDTTVYRFITSCNDACLFQKEKINQVFPVKKEGRCSQDMACHTKLHSVQPVTLNLSNLDMMLKNWKINTFETENEAREAGNNLIELHKKQLLDIGLAL